MEVGVGVGGGGGWSSETRSFLSQLARARARQEVPDAAQSKHGECDGVLCWHALLLKRSRPPFLTFRTATVQMGRPSALMMWSATTDMLVEVLEWSVVRLDSTCGLRQNYDVVHHSCTALFE